MEQLPGTGLSASSSGSGGSNSSQPEIPGKDRAFPPKPSKDIRFTSVRSDPWNATVKIMLGFVLSDLKKNICRRPIVYERQSENGDQLNSDNQLLVSKLIQCNNSLLLVCSTAPHLSHSSH